jgi:hypothetical protein
MRRTVETSGDQIDVTCDDCFFRCAELCAIPGNTPCPTFRPAVAAKAPSEPPIPVGKAPVPAAA